jgi:Arf-GAP/coiled-coil/ANK repeat/PH domain-containing protein
MTLLAATAMQVLERAQADMLNTKAAADTARLELARNLTCLESRKRYAFLEALVSVMHSHLKFFQNGFDVLRKLEPVLHQAQVRGCWSGQDVSQVRPELGN